MSTALIVRPAPLIQIPPTEPTLSQYVAQYVLEHDISRKYIAAIRAAVAQFERFVGRAIPLSELSSDAVNLWILAMEHTKFFRQATIRGKRTILKVIWKSAFEAGLIAHEPLRIRKVKVPSTAPEAWSVADIAMLLSAASQEPGKFRSGVIKSLFWQSLIRVAFDSGLRLSDLWNLKSDIRFGEGRITIEQRKTRWPISIILQPDTLESIRLSYPPEREYVFRVVNESKVVSRGLRRIARSVGLDGSTKKLRKTSASWIEKERPGEATRHLGHKSPDIAKRFYIDPTLVSDGRTLPANPLPAVDKVAVQIVRELEAQPIRKVYEVATDIPLSDEAVAALGSDPLTADNLVVIAECLAEFGVPQTKLAAWWGIPYAYYKEIRYLRRRRVSRNLANRLRTVFGQPIAEIPKPERVTLGNIPTTPEIAAAFARDQFGPVELGLVLDYLRSEFRITAADVSRAIGFSQTYLSIRRSKPGRVSFVPQLRRLFAPEGGAR